MNLIDKWRPVLSKCGEIPQDQWGPLAQLLDNQFLTMPEDGTNIQGFTRFVLPLVRKVWSHLNELGVKIEPLTSSSGTKTVPISPAINDWKEYIRAKGGERNSQIGLSLFENDLEALLTDFLSEDMARAIVKLIGSDRVYRPWQIIAPQRDQFSNEKSRQLITCCL